MSLLHFIWKITPKKKRQLLVKHLDLVKSRYLVDVLKEESFPESYKKKKCIQIHIPKCAGISVRHAIFDNEKGGSHRTAFWYKTNFPKEYLEYFTFAFVRNPWAKTLSAWSYLQRTDIPKDNAPWRELIFKIGTFNDFIKYWLDEENIYRLHFFLPQYEYLMDDLGIISLDYIGRTETISNDFDKISKRLGIQKELKITNASKHKDYRSYFSDESAEKIQRVYKKDIELLKYNFDGFSEGPIKIF